MNTPLILRLLPAFFLLFPGLAAAASPAFTLDAAIRRAVQESPRLAAYRHAIDAAEGEKQQAGLWANPELEIEAENIMGTGVHRRFDSAEVTYGVVQEFPVAGKIAARRRVADYEVELAGLERQAALLDIIHDVTVAYMRVVAEEGRMRLAQEQLELAEDVLDSVSRRVDAAAAPLIQKSRAEVEQAAAVIALDNATRARHAALRQLAARMGGAALPEALQAEQFYTVAPADMAASEAGLEANPDMAGRGALLARSRAQLALEKANTIPNPRLNAGVRDNRDMGDTAFVLGVNMPIPVFNANRGNITRAASNINRTEAENHQFRLDMTMRLEQERQRMAGAGRQVQTLEQDVLPAAENAFRLAREGYGLGRFPYLEVLDAQRSLFGVKHQHIDALQEYHTAKAALERLTAVHLDVYGRHGERETHAH